MTDSARAHVWRLCLCLSHLCEPGLRFVQPKTCLKKNVETRERSCTLFFIRWSNFWAEAECSLRILKISASNVLKTF